MTDFLVSVMIMNLRKLLSKLFTKTTLLLISLIQNVTTVANNGYKIEPSPHLYKCN